MRDVVRSQTWSTLVLRDDTSASSRQWIRSQKNDRECRLLRVLLLSSWKSWFNCRQAIYSTAPSCTSWFNAFKLQIWFYSVAVITSGSDRHYSRNVGHPGDPGSIPGKTLPFALAVSFLCRDMRKKVLKMLLECFFSEEIELIMLHPEVKIERREEHRILLISVPCRFNSVLDEGARFSNS
jgi:hypothetical protein